MCSICLPPQGITHCRRVSNPAKTECRMTGCMRDSSRQIASFNFVRLNRRDLFTRDFKCPSAKSLLVSDMETEEAMETCNICNYSLFLERLYLEFLVWVGM
ncbi:hypothetical protein NPIL_516601 [Nephila pilipes]|uniref:Uncharacterized protein n=1 Tax=Nephila pilipes TaxID=299642 RepID=A0A8X6PBI3_NEPPI|nr:hypothetical protein NPIL_568691 [Nephila pilipes]GFT58565.1 hypothetical protein NPIL_516601 [Nephila pilipes]